MNESIEIMGVAWKIDDRRGTENDSGHLVDDGQVFLADFKNLGRLNPVSRSISTVLAGLLGDAGLYPVEQNLEIPLLISSKSGFSRSDLDYFQDFVKYGETAGRANLFVYTLPTSPLADASVHFGLTGGIVYVESGDLSPWNALLEIVEDKLAAANAKGVSVPDRHILVVADEYEGGADALAVLLSTNFVSDVEPKSRARALGEYATIAELKKLILSRE